MDLDLVALDVQWQMDLVVWGDSIDSNADLMIGVFYWMCWFSGFCWTECNVSSVRMSGFGCFSGRCV